MTVRRRRSDRSGRSKLHSPGRPDSARREELVRFWAAIATGRSSEDAARDAGVSPPVGSRWFRRSGGMPPSHLLQSAKPLSGRYLSFEEREEIALLRAQGRGIRHIACRLERAFSTISTRGARRAACRHGRAQWHADRSAKRLEAISSWQRLRRMRRYPAGSACGFRIAAPVGTVDRGATRRLERSPAWASGSIAVGPGPRSPRADRAPSSDRLSWGRRHRGSFDAPQS